MSNRQIFHNYPVKDRPGLQHRGELRGERSMTNLMMEVRWRVTATPMTSAASAVGGTSATTTTPAARRPTMASDTALLVVVVIVLAVFVGYVIGGGQNVYENRPEEA
jgi:hypothetical protein